MRDIDACFAFAPPGKFDRAGTMIQWPSKFSGRVVERGDPGFDAARSVFNSSIDCRPHALLYCCSTSDVQIAVRVAEDSGRQVAVRSTGHSISGRSTADDAIVVDLSGMRDVSGSGDGLFTCQGGTRWADLDAVTSSQGFAVTGGTVSSTGVGGLTLGGGIGWLLPSSGLACDSLAGVEIVLANGEKRHVSDDSDPELMQCLRGLGHGLGVVTQFHFAARPLQQLIAGSIAVHLDTPLNDLIEQVCDLMADPPGSLTLSPSFFYRESVPVLSLDLALHNPGPSALARIDRLASHRAVFENTVRPRSYTSLQSMLDDPPRAGLRARWIPRYLNAIEPDLIWQIAQLMRSAPSKDSVIFFEHYHGEYSRPARPSVFPHRDARFAVLMTASWSFADDDDRNRRWLEEAERSIGRWVSARDPYLNYASVMPSGGPHNSWTAYQDVKKRVEPNGLFVNARPSLP